ncbi:MAG TPA: CRISPR system precrRNA processing endoribonuclease RAMP protein Cas6 [Anaerolineae bacterium]|nr:CRISPR system precrRNA processing endoribonuclease RAMP protein Cas6 [Anaerolineae bacterium]HUX77617.1 CRISPR system precrRNA processing endoribonuclease RAMP protein Cas6 [Anaerolineae bacterium]
MSGLKTYHLRITLRTETRVVLGEHKGAALRGALINALRRHYCTAPLLSAGDPARQAHTAECPVCRLVAAEDLSRTRGSDIPRPYVLEPPLHSQTTYMRGDLLIFRLGLFGDAADLYPFLLTAVLQMGHEGLGRPIHEGRRGTLSVRRIEAVNPLTREQVMLMGEADQPVTAEPTLPVTHELVQRESARWPADRITVRFLTPTRITANGRLAHSAQFQPFFQRLLERIIDLWRAYAGSDPPLDARTLIEHAAHIRLVADETRWVELESTSGRTGRRIPIGGYMGNATYSGELRPLIPWLLWGTCLHVGKNAVKGDGWFEMLPQDEGGQAWPLLST